LSIEVEIFLTEQRSLSEKLGIKQEKDEWSSVVIGSLYLFG